MSCAKKDRLIERYIEYLEVERNASPRTIIAYRHALTEFKAFAGNQSSWRNCTPQQFRAFLLECMKKGLARSYIRLRFAALRSFYKYLVERAELPENPLTFVQLPKTEKNLPVVLSIDQVDELLSAPEKIERKNQAPAWAAARESSPSRVCAELAPACLALAVACFSCRSLPCSLLSGSTAHRELR